MPLLEQPIELRARAGLFVRILRTTALALALVTLFVMGLAVLVVATID
jgi:uncharacterized membrane protein YqjE